MAEWEYLEVSESPPGVSRKVFIGHQGQEARGSLEQTVSDLLKQGWIEDSRWFSTSHGNRQWMVQLKRKKQDPE